MKERKKYKCMDGAWEMQKEYKTTCRGNKDSGTQIGT
jgi:hypothetical protein